MDIRKTYMRRNQTKLGKINIDRSPDEHQWKAGNLSICPNRKTLRRAKSTGQTETHPKTKDLE
jgi:hypothetical protein